MKDFTAFYNKEILEQLRTYRIYIMLSVFFVFGIMNPLMAKLLPQILSGMEIEGMTVIIPKPTAMDSYVQFFKNTTQMGMLVLLLVFGGTISNELTKGTLIIALAKGLRRHTVILAKYAASITLWTISFTLECLITQAYTVYLFDTSSIKNLVLSMFCLWLFGSFVLSLIFFSSAIASGSFGGLILTAAILGGLLILDIFPAAEKINPIYLSSNNLKLLSGVIKPADVVQPLLITVVLLIAFLYSSIILFRKKNI